MNGLDSGLVFSSSMSGGGGGGYTLAIGNPIVGATNNYVLVVDGSGQLDNVPASTFGTAVSAPQYSVQYNNPLGSLGSDAQFLRNPTSGLFQAESTFGSHNIGVYVDPTYLGAIPVAGLINDDGVGYSRVISGDGTGATLSPYTINFESDDGAGNNCSTVVQPSFILTSVSDGVDLLDISADRLRVQYDYNTLRGFRWDEDQAIPRYVFSMSNSTNANAVIQQYSLFNTLPAVPGYWDMLGMQSTATQLNFFVGTNITYPPTLTGSLNWMGSGLQALTTGGRNVAWGYGSLSLLTTGSRNTAGGSVCASQLVSGSRVTAYGDDVDVNAATSDATIIGQAAGSPNLTGLYATILGQASGTSLSTAEATTIVGGFSGVNLTTGGGHFFGGYNVGGKVVSGTQSVLIGNGVANTGATANFNNAVIIGNSAGASQTASGVVILGHSAASINASADVIVIGRSAFQNHGNSGTSQIVIGVNAGNGLFTTDSDNTVIGQGAVRDGIGGVNRATVVGHSAGEDLENVDCTLVGYKAGQLLKTTSNSVTVVGSNSLVSATSDCIDMVVIGSTTAQLTTDVDSCVIIGTDAFQNVLNNGPGIPTTQHVIIGNDCANTTTQMGVQNVLIGDECAKNIVAGETVAIGYQSLAALTSGTSNTAVGWKSGAGATGSRNVFLGHNLADSIDTNDSVFVGADQNLFAASGDRLILIGSTATVTSSSFDDGVAIGYGASLNGSNQFVVGSGSSAITDYWLGKGQESVSPVDITLQPTRGLGTNIAGKKLILKGGGSTGNGVGGDIEFWTATAGASGTTQRLPTVRLTIDQNSNIRATGLHDNATAQGSATEQDIRSGTYTATITGVANVNASSAFKAQWKRVGNVVSVSGKVDIDPTADATLTSFRMSLPVASNLAAEQDLGGSGAGRGNFLGQAVAISGDATNNEAFFEFTSVGTDSASISFIFQYEVL